MPIVLALARLKTPQSPEVKVSTPPKTNIEPENGPLEEEIPFGNHHFSGSMFNFGGVPAVILWCPVTS